LTYIVFAIKTIFLLERLFSHTFCFFKMLNIKFVRSIALQTLAFRGEEAEPPSRNVVISTFKAVFLANKIFLLSINL